MPVEELRVMKEFVDVPVPHSRKALERQGWPRSGKGKVAEIRVHVQAHRGAVG